MYEHFRGPLAQLTPTYAVVEAAGVGYCLNISLNTYAALQRLEPGAPAMLYAHHVVRDDAQLLFGFATADERALFRQLIAVSGVGANTARMILSSLEGAELRSAIAQGDVATLKGVKGIGLKTAQRIVVELKDKMGGAADAGDTLFGEPEGNTVKEETLSALVMLGFARKAAEGVVNAELGKDPSLGVEELIKLSLKKL